MKRFFSLKIVIILICALILGFADLPASVQKSIVPFAPDFLTNASVKLGLDLKGGSQLDYKINLNDVPEQDRADKLDEVVERTIRRVNALGVSEPNIYISTVGDEEHVIVELAGIQDLEEAKATIGRIVQLEFKEPRVVETDVDTQKIQTEAEATLQRVLNGEDFAIVGQEIAQSNIGKVTYEEDEEAVIIDRLGQSINTAIDGIEAGKVVPTLAQNDQSYTVIDGQLVQDSGFLILKVLERNKEVKYDKEIDASHILVTYVDSSGANEETTLTKEEAKARAEEVRQKVLDGEDWNKLAEIYSDDGSNFETGGVLTKPVNPDASYVPEFIEGTLQLNEAGDISEIVETEFGFHVIKADAVRKNVEVEQVKLARIKYSTAADPWQSTGLTGKNFVHADLQFSQLGNPAVSVVFDDEGAQMFSDITERLSKEQKQLAIFVDGILISAPSVNEKIAGGEAIISSPTFTFETAQKLAKDLNTGAFPAPLILTGEFTIEASLGATALNQSVQAGILGLIILAIFMLLLYRLPGLIANIALGIYSIILLFVIKIALPAPVAVIGGLTIFVFASRAIFNSKDSSLEKLLAFLLSIFAFVFFSQILQAPITLTLAGVAGVILSIGMAVDANILIFERMKEELRQGHNLQASIENGFERAWSSIRDSNFSSLITCAILAFFGSSIIRGFAINLAAGILISMFSAITLTRTFLLATAKTKLGKNKWLFNAGKTREPLKIIEKSKLWFGISGVLIAISLFFTFTQGLKLGIDFTGGTFMEMQFQEDVSKEDLVAAFEDIETGINDGSLQLKEKDILDSLPPEIEPTESSEAAVSIQSVEKTDSGVTIESGEKLDLQTAQIVAATGENHYFIKSKYISADQHDIIIQELKTQFGEFDEPRFTTIGPTVGKVLKNKAIIALTITLVMIILYIAFAFRKVPKAVGKWKFGASAIFALLHDLIITVGVFSVLGMVLNVEIDALFITALLTVLGFSVHDTIVVFDRLRENLKYQTSNETLSDTTNKALTETMARSINTSLSTLITLLALLFLGSSSIFYFVLALVIGVVVGTYSSIFTASPILVAWSKKSK